MARGCEFCVRAGAAVEASFSRNVGMLIMRRAETIAGRHCARCLTWNFLRMQGLNMLLGWWGTISFVMTIFFSLSNVFHLVSGGATLAFEAAGARATRVANERARERVDAGAELARFRNTIKMRLRRGETVEVIARDMVDAANVPLHKAEAFVAELAASELR
jgi:hypothetical protein